MKNNASKKTEVAQTKPAPATATPAVPVRAKAEKETVASTSESVTNTKISPREKRLEYVVQLSASAKKLASGGGKWDRVDNVMIRYEKSMYKYQVGVIESYDEAVKTKGKLKKIGFEDCFIVAYLDDQQIGVREALALK